eukprot:scaffold317060_cov18-Tisochrysis_lutea.AAC.1
MIDCTFINCCDCGTGAFIHSVWDVYDVQPHPSKLRALALPSSLRPATSSTSPAPSTSSVVSVQVPSRTHPRIQ